MIADLQATGNENGVLLHIGSSYSSKLSIIAATFLRDQLTAAIEEAKRQSDMMSTVAVLLTQDELERLISSLQTKHGEPPSQRDWSLKFADRLKRLRGDGDTPETEFFVIRLKDKYAAQALYAYANQARHDDPEWAEEIFALADKAKAPHETGNRKIPD